MSIVNAITYGVATIFATFGILLGFYLIGRVTTLGVMRSITEERKRRADQ